MTKNQLHCFKLRWSFLICQMLTKFSGSNPNGPYLGWENEKETFCFVLTYSTKWAHKIRKFHVAVMQQQLRNAQKSVDRHKKAQKSVDLHIRSCFFANLNLLFLCCSPSPLQKLPIVVIQKFCNYGNTTSHFSPLLSNKIACCCPLPTGKNPDRLWNKTDPFIFLKEMHLNSQYSTYSGEEKFLLLCFSS